MPNGGKTWELEPGDAVRRTELHDRYGGGRQGGIAPSRESDNVLIFTDPRAGTQHGYIYDGWDQFDPTLFRYTGEGQQGDQRMVAGNRAIYEHAARGRALFEGKGSCGTCHRVRGRGPRMAPDLSDIGVSRTPAALQRSLRDPSSAMLPINRPVRIVMRDGRAINGRRLNEDTYTVQIIDDTERLMSLAKSDIRNLEVSTVSTMPSYASTLTPDEQADLVAYLLSLREP